VDVDGRPSTGVRDERPGPTGSPIGLSAAPESSAGPLASSHVGSSLGRQCRPLATGDEARDGGSVGSDVGMPERDAEAADVTAVERSESRVPLPPWGSETVATKLGGGLIPVFGACRSSETARVRGAPPEGEGFDDAIVCDEP